eukprot:gene11040-14824_t
MYHSSSVYAVSYQARAMCAQKASTERHRFIVGTCSLHDSNELSVLQYFEDSNQIEAAAVFSHPDQIWAIESSGVDSALVVTSREAQNGAKCLTLWKMPSQSKEDIEKESGDGFTNERLELTEITTFHHSHKPTVVSSLKWNKNSNRLVGIDGKVLSIWNLDQDKAVQSDSLILVDLNKADDSSQYLKSGCVSWDPHNSSLCATAFGTELQLVDTREMEVTNRKQMAHASTIRDVDYNPNKPLTLMTSGDDRKIKFWDVRNLKIPTMSLSGHSHWVWCAKYNPFHDQLIVSGGSDSMVNLWRIASISSSPWLTTQEGENEFESTENDPPNIKVRSMDQHEDSVYSVAWSPADAWIYCSMSFDGRIMVNNVPSTEKYKILL